MLWFPVELYLRAWPAQATGSVRHWTGHRPVFDTPNVDVDQTKHERPPKNVKSSPPPENKTSQYPTSRPSSSRRVSSDASGASYTNHDLKDNSDYELDYEAQAYVPSAKKLKVSPHFPGHFAIAQEGRRKETELFASDTTRPLPPSETHGESLLTPLTGIPHLQEHQLSHDPSDLTFSNRPLASETTAQSQYPILSQPAAPETILQPRPRQHIPIDHMSILADAEKLVPPKPHSKYAAPTFSEFLRRTKEVEECITSNYNYRPPSESPDWAQNQIQTTSNGVTPSMYDQRHSPIITEGNPDGLNLSHHGSSAFDQEASRDHSVRRPSSRSPAYRPDTPQNYARSDLQPPKPPSKYNYGPSSDFPDCSQNQIQTTSNGVTPSMYGQRHSPIITEGNPNGLNLSHHGSSAFDQEASRDQSVRRPSSRSPAYRPDTPQNYARSDLQPPEPQRSSIEKLTNTSAAQRQQHSVHLPNSPETNMHITYEASYCLKVIDEILRSMYALGPDLDDVREAMSVAQSCVLQRQEIPRGIWKERYGTWNTLYSRKIDSLTICVLLIKGMLQTGNIDEAHEIHFIAEEVLEIASNLRASFHRLRDNYVRKVIRAQGARKVPSSLHSQQ